MFHHPAWAVGSYRSGPLAGELPKSKSTRPRSTRTWDARAMDMEKADNLERAVSFLIVSGERHLAPGERRLQLLQVPVDHALVDVLYLLLQ